jgi:3-hydroxybutyrate dehydrogenase
VGQSDGRVAVVTGSTGGIGLAIAKGLFDDGASIVLNGRNKDKGEHVLAEMEAGDRGIFVPADVSQREGVENLLSTADAHFGSVDILVNNAGGATVLLPTVDMTDEAWDEVMKWNVYSTFWATRAALKLMIPRQWGRIINISSVEGKHGKPVVTAYVAAKHAINGMTKSVAKEVGTLGITVNSICPGLVLTDIVRSSGPATAAAMGLTFEGMVDLFAQESAIKRPNTVEEVAAVAVLLCSEVASGITGALWSVDGGTAAY